MHIQQYELVPAGHDHCAAVNVAMATWKKESLANMAKELERLGCGTKS
jgi:hypothetical protein